MSVDGAASTDEHKLTSKWKTFHFSSAYWEKKFIKFVVFVINAHSRSLAWSGSGLPAISAVTTAVGRDPVAHARCKTSCSRNVVGYHYHQQCLLSFPSLSIVSTCPRLNGTDLAEARLAVVNGRTRGWNESPTGLFLFPSLPRDIFPFRFKLIDLSKFAMALYQWKNRKAPCISPKFNSK